MLETTERASTGLAGLDEILDGLRIGDNVVWKVNSLEDYRTFVEPFVTSSLAEGRRVVYMRFGQHPPLIDADRQVVTYKIDPRLGFDSFCSRIHRIIRDEGKEVFYIFDSLSDLLSAWATDHMVGNFFKVTCPYLYELDTVAYFALIRGHHALRTIARIRETTQVLLDLFPWDDELYVQPLKVWGRHSPTMFLHHRRVEERFTPVANSRDATALMTAMHRNSRTHGNRHLDHWHRLFLQAEKVAAHGEEPEQSEMVAHLCRHLIGREERILALAHNNFSLDDLLEIKSRMVGTGFIGGKAVGMLLARNILLRSDSDNWTSTLEEHDSFFVGSNVYYSYLVHNGWWRLLMQQKSKEGYFDTAEELRQKMQTGQFPDLIREGFIELLEYYGQYPIIVRSSSLLEDSFGSAFAGKYESFFCANQGSLEERLEAFEDAVRRIYASTMSEDALTYRLQRGLDRQDEQMGLLVQRVSGAYHRHYYFPDMAGVGVSYNTFVWDRGMDPKAGMLRLVLGLGTRAVDRVEGDYPRIVALDAPQKQPYRGTEDARRYAQRDLDLVNVESNSLETHSLFKLLEEGIDLGIQRVAILDREAMNRQAERGRKPPQQWLPTFDPLLAQPHFTTSLQRMLKILEGAYNYPVHVEFTINFNNDDTFRLNLLQCRPLQTKGMRQKVQLPQQIESKALFFRSEGNFMGGNILQPLRWLVWVDPAAYSRLSLNEKHEVARIIGRLNRRIADREQSPTLLLGPGRWGTSTPSLGVPVTFAEISNVSVLGEVAFSRGDLMPELSYGSHFFQDLVEADIFYLALFPESRHCTFHDQWGDKFRNAFEALLPSCSAFKKVVRVFSFPEKELVLAADVVQQKLICHLDH
ncbi:MAG: phosphoenolpyruvate synthase [Desulfuromonas sp.]|nr:MAG: phosphoenolpyruvate synthase [Desulfuromonas sp.]